MPIFHKQTEVGDGLTAELSGQRTEGRPQATQTLFVFYIRDSIHASGVLDFLLDRSALWVGGLKKVGIDLQLRHIGFYRVAGIQA